MTNEDMAQALAATGDYRVLRRLPDLPRGPLVNDGNVRSGLYVDCETTGTDTEKDAVTELCVLPFWFSTDGLRFSTQAPVRWLNDPGVPISPEVSKMTGITDNMVKGQSIDLDHLNGILDVTDIVIAHNAEFDRPMLERVSRQFVRKCWGCSMSQVPWETSTRKLEWLLCTMGHFYDAHGAVEDCRAGLFAITRPLNESTGLAHILEASRKSMWHCWAIDAPYDKSGKLQQMFKERGYYWNSKDNGKPKAWHKEVEDVDAERTWLAMHAYRRATVPARFDKVTAFDRFTKRG